MEHQIKKEPQFWINPNFRLNSPHFRFAWFKADMTVLRQEAMIMSVERKVYQTSTQCVVCMIKPDHSSLDIVYADNQSICKMLYINNLHFKRKKSGDVDSTEKYKRGDLTF